MEKSTTRTRYTYFRDELKKYKDEDGFNDKSMEGMEWDNYIRDNMTFAEDV